jgi:hypothetical protein
MQLADFRWHFIRMDLVVAKALTINSSALVFFLPVLSLNEAVVIDWWLPAPFSGHRIWSHADENYGPFNLFQFE